MRATSLGVIPSPDEDHTQNYDTDHDNTNDNTYNKIGPTLYTQSMKW